MIMKNINIKNIIRLLRIIMKIIKNNYKEIICLKLEILIVEIIKIKVEIIPPQLIILLVSILSLHLYILLLYHFLYHFLSNLLI